MKRILNCVFLAAFVPLFGYGQTEGKDPLSAGQINVVQDYRPVIGDADKISPNPVLNDSVPAPLKLNYPVLSRNFFVPFRPEPLQAAKMKGEPLSRLNPFSVKAGYGLYNTSLAEISASSLRSKRWKGSFLFKHLAAGGKIDQTLNPGFADQDFKLNGHYLFNQHDLQTTLNYYHHKVHYYGGVFAPQDEWVSTVPRLRETDGRIYYSMFEGSARIKGIFKDKDRFQRDAGLRYYYLGTTGSHSEYSVGGDVMLGKYTKNGELIGAKVQLDYFGQSRTPDSTEAAIFGFNPFYQIGGKKFDFKLGLKIMVESDASLTRFFPDIFARYHIVEDVFSAYAQVTGNTRRNTIRSLSEQNPFIVPDIAFRNTADIVDASLGLRGNISSRLFFDISGQIKLSDSVAFFVNKPVFADSAQNNFTVIYDGMQTYALQGSLGYRMSSKLEVTGFVRYQMLKPDSQLRAWHMPSIEGALRARYSLGDKLLVRADLLYVGERYARITTLQAINAGIPILEFQERKLKGIFDVNIGADYRYTKNIGAFVQFNNIAAQRFVIWNNYPLQRFNAMIGLRVNF
jgi:hypothetical protein